MFNSLISDKVCPSQALDIFVDRRLEEAPADGTENVHKKWGEAGENLANLNAVAAA